MAEVHVASGNIPPGPHEGRAASALSALLQELASAPDAPEADGWDQWLRPGATVARYALVREIGRGGFGVVWEAVETGTGRRLAFKALRPGRRRGPQEERLLREAEVAARLAHPNIVSVEDAGRTDEGPYLVLELLQGRSLAERLASGPLPAELGVAVALDVARALAHAHAQGVVHRDLKPGNVFLCDGGAVKVLDFGMAHAFGQRRADGGTPAYMAPEQWRGAPEDERTDVFALGVLLFRMLAGELPFPDDGGATVQGSQPAPEVDVPGAAALGELVSRLLEKDPVKRPRDAGAVVPILEAALGELRRAPAAVASAPVRIRRIPPANARSYDLCQRGTQFLRQTRRTSLRFACAMFERCIALDPLYAPAHAGLAEGTAVLRMYYPAGEEDLGLADRASARALELDPGLAEAHVARGLVLLLQQRLDESDAALSRAIELAPRYAEAWYYRGRARFQQGRFAEAASHFRRANEVREDYQAAFFAAQATEAEGRADEALLAYRSALAVVERHMELNPDDPRAATARAVSLCRIGRKEDGMRWADEALAIDPLDAGVRYNVACLYALEGATERALDALEAAVKAGFGNSEWFERDPDLASLRGHPRFRELIGKP